MAAYTTQRSCLRLEACAHSQSRVILHLRFSSSLQSPFHLFFPSFVIRFNIDSFEGHSKPQEHPEPGYSISSAIDRSIEVSCTIETTETYSSIFIPPKRSLAGPTVSSTPSRGIQHSFYLTRHSFTGHQLLRHGSNTKRPGMHSQLPRSLLLHHCPCHFHYIVCSFGTGTYSYTYACIGRCCI